MLAKKLHYVTDEVRNQCLTKFIEACKYRHALAFFQWRERYTPTADKGILKAVWEGRLDALKREEKKKQDQFKLAEIIEKRDTMSIEDLTASLDNASLAKSDS